MEGLALAGLAGLTFVSGLVGWWGLEQAQSRTHPPQGVIEIPPYE